MGERERKRERAGQGRAHARRRNTYIIIKKRKSMVATTSQKGEKTRKDRLVDGSTGPCIRLRPGAFLYSL
jgi:hypothetical protein